MQEEKKQELISIYRDGLLENTLPFWRKHGVDHEYGGFITSLDLDGSIVDTDKSVWQQGRFTWFLGELFNNVDRNIEWLELAKHGIDFLDKYCFDPDDGRMWFQLDREGRPIRKRRYSYSESFAAIAYGEYAQASGNQQYAIKAKDTFQKFVDHNLNSSSGDSKFTNTRPMRGIGFPMIGIFTAQELRRSIGLDDANDWIDRFINDFRQYFVKPEIPMRDGNRGR